MKKYIIIFLTLLSFFPIRTNALELEKTFSNYTNTSCDAMNEIILESYNQNGNLDGYISCDNYYNICTKYDLDNNRIWTNDSYASEIGINQISSENTDGIIVNGASDVIITKYTTDNTVEWTKQFGGNKNEILDIVIKSFDNENNHDGYIFLGTTDSSNLDEIIPGSILVKYDLQGNLLWIKNTNNHKKVLLLDDTSTDVTTVYQTSDTKFEVLDRNNELINRVSTNNVNINDLFFSKDKNGKVDGIMVVGTTGNYYYYSTIEKRYTDNLSTTVKPITNIIETAVIIKYDLAGNKLWEKSLDGQDESGYYSGILLESPDGKIEGYLALGGVMSNSTSSSIIVMYALDGNKIWQDKYSPYNDTAYSDITKSYDQNGNLNGYAVVAFNTESYVQPSSFSNNSAIVKSLQTCNRYAAFVKYTFKEYSIIKKETKEGIISVNDKAIAGTIVKLNITPKDGYLLKKIIIKDESDNKIEITDNSFTMPNSEVTIEAIFAKVANPETVAAWYLVLGIVLLISVATYIINKQKDLN